MSKLQNKVCPGCNKVFKSKNAITCSDRCRMRMHRAMKAISNETEALHKAKQALAHEATAIKKSSEHTLKSTEENFKNLGSIVFKEIYPDIATEEGFIGDGTDSTSVATAPRTAPPETVINPIQQVNEAFPQSTIIQPVQVVDEPQSSPVKASMPSEFVSLDKPSLESPVSSSIGDVAQGLDTPEASANEVPDPGFQIAAQNQPLSEEINTPRRPFMNFGLRRWAALATAIIILGGCILLIPFNSRGGQNSPPVQVSLSTQSLSSITNSSSQTIVNSGTLHLNRDTIIDLGKTLTATGQVLFKNSTDSTAAFRVQDASGNNLIAVDTVNGTVTIAGFQGGFNTANLNTTLQGGAGINLVGRLITNSGVLSINGLSGDIAFTGTANQILLGMTGNNITLSLPQNIGTSSTPNFQSIVLATAGTQNGNEICDTSGNCAGIGGTGDVLQGGNTFGTALTLGTNDNYGLNLETNNTTVASFSNIGQATFQNSSNSTTAFRIQDALSNNLVVVDTTNGTVTIVGLQGSGAGLTNLNASNVSSGTLADAYLSTNVTLQGNTFNGASQLVQTTAGGALPVLSGINLTNLDASNITLGTLVDSRLSSNVPLKNDANIFTAVNTFRNDSASAFRVQDAAGTNSILVVDTNANRVAIGQASANYTLDVAGDINISAGSTYRINGNSICDASGCIPASGSNNYIMLQGGSPGTQQPGNANISGTIIAGYFFGDGSSLTNLNASNISSGTLADARLSTNVTLQGNSFNGVLQLVQLDASGFLPGLNASALTSLNASQLTSGTVADARLSTNVTLQGNTFNGASQLVQLTAGGILPVLSGANLTNLNASNITSGTLADARLSTNVTLQGNTFNGISQLVQLDAFGYLPALNGSALTNLNASNISSGTLADARLSTNVTLQGNTFNGASQLVQLNGSIQLPAVSGALLTNLNATNIASGTLADSRLSTNVALLNGSGPQTFTGNNKFTGTVLAENAVDSVAAFQVQNAAGNELLRVDTSGSHIALGKASTLTTDLIFYNAGGSGSITLQGSNPGVGNYAITLPAASGTVCLTSGNCAGIGGTGDILQGGNSFGTTLTLGTNDNYGLNLEVNNTTVISLSNSGAALFKNASDSMTAFQVQNVAGTSNLLIADTANSRIGIGKAPVSGILDVNGTIYQDGSEVCDASGNCAGTGGNVGGSGTPGTIAVFTAASTIGDSNLAQSGLTTTATGTFVATTALQAPLLDTASATALGIGNTNATSVSICNSANCDAINIGTNADADTINIGDSLDTLTLQGNSSSTIVFNGVTISAAELNLLDTHDVALVDTNDAVATAITGTGALNAGSITSGFGSIDTGADNITTTGTVQGTTSVLTTLLDTVSAVALNIGTTNATAINLNQNTSVSGAHTFTTGTGAVSLNGDTTVATGKNFTVTSGVTQLTGTTSINTSGTADTTIGNVSGGTITIGATSGSNLILQDAQWGVTGAGAATFASIDSGSGTIVTTGTLQGNNFDRSTSGALTFGNTNATSVSICNSANCDAINIGTNADADTINIGDSLDTLTLQGNSSSTIVFNGVTISAAELNLLDTHDVALVDTNDAVATAITGTGALNAGSITSGFGSIDTGADNITTTGTVNGNTLDRSTAGTLSVGTTNATAITLGGATTVSTAAGGLTVTTGKNLTVNGDAFTDLTGNGLTVSGSALTVQVTASADALSSTTSSGSGLEVLSSGVTLLQGCGDAQILQWNETTDVWVCATNGAGSTTLQNAYNNSSSPATITLATGKNLVFTSPDVATDPSVIFNLQCTTCSAGGGKFKVQSGGSDVFTVSPNGGAALFQNSINSTTAFQIQNATSGPLFVVDSTTGRIAIGQTSASYTVDVAGDININGAYRINGTSICTTAGCTIDSTSGIQNQSSVDQTANFRISGTGRANTSFLTPLLDTATAGTLSLGTTNATAINLNQNTTVAAAKTFVAYGTALFKNSVDSTTAFQIQNSSGTSVLNVATANNNLLSNPSFESNANGWVLKGSATVSSSDTYALYGSRSLKIATTAAANDGATGYYNFLPSTQYSLSLYARLSSGTATTINIGRQDDGASDTDCLTGQSASTTWTQFTCTFTTGATIAGTSNIYIKQTDASARTIYIDGVTLVSGASAQAYNPGGSNLQIDNTNNIITLNSTNSGALGPWQLSGNALPTARSGGSSIVANGYVYEIGGYNGGAQSTVYYAKLNADGSTGSWNATTTLPAARNQQTSVVANGYVYVIGGSATSTIYYAKLNSDGTVGSWSTNANALPVVRDQHTSVVANGYVYVIGGNTGGAQSTVYYAKLNADGSTGAWSTNANALPTTMYAHSSAVANGYIYTIGGYNGSYLNAVSYAKLNADGSTGSWSTTTVLPVSNRYGLTSVVANGYIYALAGYGGASATSTIYYAKLNADGTVGSWSTNTNALPAVRANQASVVANGYVYVIGGWNSTDQSTVYYASTSRIQVAGSLDLVGLSGQNLSDPGDYSQGSTGGSLTAGNTQIVGSLSVQGQSNFSQGMSVLGNFTNSGSALFANSSNSNTAFSVQNSTGTSVLGIATANNNLLSNPSFESNTNGWVLKGSATIAQSATYAQYGSQSLKITTTAAANDGATGYYNFLPSTQYSLSFSARLSSGTATTINIGRQDDGSTDTDCLTGQSLSTTWTQFTCTFTTGATIAGTSNIYIKQTDASARTIYIDGVSLVAGATPQAYNPGGANLQIDNTNNIITLNSTNSGALGAWQLNSNVLPDIRQAHTSVVANGYVYVIGGDTGYSAQSTVYYAKLNADGSTGAWSTNANPLPAVREFHTSVVANGYVYVIGGDTNNTSGGNNPQSTVYYAKLNADGSTGAWSTNANPLPAVRQLHTSVVANGYVYVIGGDILYGSNGRSTVYYAKLNADGSTGAWQTNSYAIGCATPGCGSPVARANHTSVVANGYVYVIGGGTTVYYAKLNADGSTGAWSTNANPLPYNRNNPTSVVANGYVYVIAGNECCNTIRSTVYYAKLNADGSTGAWSTNTNALPAVRVLHTSVVANGYVYVISGSNGSNTKSTVFYASTSRIQMAGSLDLVGLSDGNLSEGGDFSQGSTGGSLTAGNTQIVGSLSVQGQSNFSQGMSVLGNFTNTGSALFKDSANSTKAFQVQNTAGNAIFAADTTNNIITLNGTNSGSLGPWQLNSNPLPATRLGQSSVVANGYIYAIGGYIGSASQTTVYYAKLNTNGSVDTWQTNANPLPVALSYHTSVVANGYVYVIGGATGVYYAKLNADGSTGTWTTSANPLPAGRDHHTSVVANGYVYVIGGSNSSTVWYAKLNADGSTGAWSTNSYAIGCTTPGCGSPATRGAQSSVVANGYVYVIAGIDSGAAYQTTVYYAKLNADGSTGAWSTSTALSVAQDYSTSVVANGYVYVMGGYSTTGGAKSTVYYAKLNADGSTGTWNTSTLLTPLWQHSSVIANGYIYTLGGCTVNCNPGDRIAAVYYASTSRVQMAGSLDLVGLNDGNLSDPGDFSQGSTGGSLTAGNTQIVGSLSVQGQSNFSQGMSLDKELRVGGSVLFQDATNSTTAFQVQNTSSKGVLTADTSNGQVLLGNTGSGGVNGTLVFNSATAGNYAVTLGATSSLAASYTLKLPTGAPSTGQCLQTTAGDSTQLIFGSCAGSSSGMTAIGTIDSQTKSSDGAVSASGNLVLQSADASYPGLVSTGTQTFAGAKTFTGAALFKNLADSTTAFQIQNAAGTSNLLIADTTNTRIGIGMTSPQYTLDLAGDINITGAYRIGGVAICTSSGCTPSSGSDNYIQLQGSTPGSPQTGHFNISGTGIAGTSLLAPLIGLDGGTGDRYLRFISGSDAVQLSNLNSGGIVQVQANQFQVQDNTGYNTNLLIDNNGAVTFENRVNSTKAFQVQNTAGNAIFTADTTNNIVKITPGVDGGLGGGTAKLAVESWWSETSDDIALIDFGEGATTGNESAGRLRYQGNTNMAYLSGVYNTTETPVLSFDRAGGSVKLQNSNTNGSLILQNNVANQGVLVKPGSGADSTTAFQIQNAAGTSNLFVADTTNSRIGIGTNAPIVSLQVVNSGNPNLIVENSTNNSTEKFGHFGVQNYDTSQNPFYGYNLDANSGTNDLNLGGGTSSGTAATGIHLFVAANSTTATGTEVATIDSSGAALFKNRANSTTAFQVQNAGSTAIITADTTNSKIQIGSSTTDATAILLVLDSYNTTDPSGTNGAMYYSTSTNTFRCYENGAWTDCLSRHKIVLSGDVADNSGACTYTALTGLSFAVTAGQSYRFHLLANYTSAATATGAGFSITGPATPTMLSMDLRETLTATTGYVGYNSAYDNPATCSATSLAAANIAQLEGVIIPSSNGTVQVDFATEINASAITVKAGSTLEWW